MQWQGPCRECARQPERWSSVRAWPRFGCMACAESPSNATRPARPREYGRAVIDVTPHHVVLRRRADQIRHRVAPVTEDLQKPRLLLARLVLATWPWTNGMRACVSLSAAGEYRTDRDTKPRSKPGEGHPHANNERDVTVCRTCCFFMEAIPLHLPTANVAADEILAVAEEDAVADRVNVRRRKIADASVTGILAVIGLGRAHKLFSDLRTNPTNVCHRRKWM